MHEVERFLEKIHEGSSRKTPPWRVYISRLAARKTGWLCPYCGSDVLVQPVYIECWKEHKEEIPSIDVCYEFFCSNKSCKYDKIVIVRLISPYIQAPKEIYDFECEILSG